MVSSRRRTLSLIAVLTVLVFFAWVVPGQTAAYTIDPEIRGGWQPGPDIYHPSRVIVRFSDAITTNAATDSIQRLGYSVYRVADFKPTAAFPSGVRFGIVELPEGVSPDNAISRLGNAPEILYAERDYIRYKDQVYTDTPIIPNDPEFAKLWGLHNENCQHKDPRMQGNPVDDADIDAPEAWAVHTGTEDVVVAVIDTGCYIYHPDLFDNIWVNEAEMNGTPGVDDDGNGYIDDFWGWDFFSNDNTVWDPDQRDRDGYLVDEHGTHCAGTIGACGNNNMGITGINWNVKIMPLKFIGPDGGYSSDAILAIEYAASKGAKIANCSWGGGAYSRTLEEAMEGSGMLIVAAAGNSGVNTDVTPHYPSCYDLPNIISVAASMQNDQPCSYRRWWSTNYGHDTVDLFAPGGYILSTVPPDPPPESEDTPQEAYAFFYGTSMATPHVSGVAALVHGNNTILPLYPGALGWVEGALTVKDVILQTVDVKPDFQGRVSTGGRLNAARALATPFVPSITSVAVEPTYGAPPLVVTFSASVIDPVGEIIDVWWDFGDGSDVVHECDATHTYEEQGRFQATFHAVNDSGLESSTSIQIHVFFPPSINVSPSFVESNLSWGEVETQSILVSNYGSGELRYTVELQKRGLSESCVNTSNDILDVKGASSPMSSGGPDRFGYSWIDSDDSNGPVFEWNDISGIGEELSLAWNTCQTLDLPFVFPFYGEPKTEVCISGNGYMTFGIHGEEGQNTRIPDPREPNDLIAVFWNDLAPDRGGHVYYYSTEDCFIVQYDNVLGITGSGPHTFQVILKPDGVIVLQYLHMEYLNRFATIGIENAMGTDGLEVVYKAEYVHDNLAVMFTPCWISASPSDGVISPGDSAEIEVTFRAYSLPQRSYQDAIVVRSNDPARPEVSIDAVLNVNSLISPVVSHIWVTPQSGGTPLTVDFFAEAFDHDGEIVNVRWDFGDGSESVVGSLRTSHTYVIEGEYDATLTVTDDDGLHTNATVHISARPTPKIGVDPDRLSITVRAHRDRTETLRITNEGDSDLEYEIEAIAAAVPVGSAIHPDGFGGPDGHGYTWKDSDDPDGPVFEWIDITTVGTPLPLLDDDQWADISLPWRFPFYGLYADRAKISANGFIAFDHLTFEGGGGRYNTPMPDPTAPNGILAVFWDDLKPGDGGMVYFYHDQINSRFIVEWNNVPRRTWRDPDTGSYTFQAILYPNGTVVYQYLDMRFGAAYGACGTIGIENSSGTVGIEVLYNSEGYMHDGLAIRFEPFEWLSATPSNGRLAPGESTDIEALIDLSSIKKGTLQGSIIVQASNAGNTRTVVPVSIEVMENQPPVVTACAVTPPRGPCTTTFSFAAAAYDKDGYISRAYWDFGDGSTIFEGFVAEHTYVTDGTYAATFCAIDNDGYETISTVTVYVQELPSATWDPRQLSFRVPQGQYSTSTLTIGNTGLGLLEYGSHELGEVAQTSVPSSGDRHFIDDAYVVNDIWLSESLGRVIRSWPAPHGIKPLAVCVNHNTGDLVISDGSRKTDFVVTPEGVYTGKCWTTPWATSAAGEMAFDGSHIWQVNTRGDGGIYQLDSETGEVITSIVENPWAQVYERGLAYDPETDTFYTGGWRGDDIIYHIKGLSWDFPGEVIEEWVMPVAIAGLAYHPNTNMLAVASQADPDMIYLVNLSDHSIVARIKHPAGTENAWTGSGIDFDADGNLWVVSLKDKKMYLIETGLGTIREWLTWSPAKGTVMPGTFDTIAVTASSLDIGPGRHYGTVRLHTNDLEYPIISIPATMEVVRPPIIVEASAEPTLGEPPLAVRFCARVDAGEAPIADYIWDFGDGTSEAALDVVHVYTQQGTYTAVFSVVDEFGSKASTKFIVDVRPLPAATVDPNRLEFTLGLHDTAMEYVTLSNKSGSAPLNFRVKVKFRSRDCPIVETLERIGLAVNQDALTAEGLYEPLDPEAVREISAAAERDSVGTVIMSWPAPAPISMAWGIGYDGDNIWISDPTTCRDYVVTPDGAYTGVEFQATWVEESWPGDMAYDKNRDLMWQVNVGGDNGIYALNTRTGEVTASITSGSWTQLSQRGLAYDSRTDTFYIGGWNQNIIYHVKGLSWDCPGQVLKQWSFPVSIAGLAWHPDGILWVSTNSDPDMIYGVDLSLGKAIFQFQHPAKMSYSGAGIEIHDDGNLWVASQKDNSVYLVSTDMPIDYGIRVTPTEGTVAVGDSVVLEVTANGERLGVSGETVLRRLDIQTNDPRIPVLGVDIVAHIKPGPSISEIHAFPAIGEPPLEVTFTAVIDSHSSSIVDLWWEFGDGSDPIHDTNAVHIFESIGEYEASFHVVDEFGVETVKTTSVMVKWLPVLGVYPMSFDKVIPHGAQAQECIYISNSGNGSMSFQITTMPDFSTEQHTECDSEADAKQDGVTEVAVGGPDRFGYVWIDSAQPEGPQFDWTEINEIGTRILMEDESWRTLMLPFEFPFYGDAKTHIGISANGYLSFDLGALRGYPNNTPIPDPSRPNSVIAVFWDDLDPGAGGNVYYYYDHMSNSFIVEFEDVPRKNDNGQVDQGSFTFQVILKPNGTIIYQYLHMDGNTESCTVGIENSMGDDGVQVTHNASYVKDGLAVAIVPVGAAIKVNPTSGYVIPGGIQPISLLFGTGNAAADTYSFYIYVTADDPNNPIVQIPIALKLNLPPSVNLTAPKGGEIWAGEQEIKWTAEDPDDPADALKVDMYWLLDGGEWNEIATGLPNTGSYMWNTAEVGLGGDAFRVRIVVTDPAGETVEAISEAFAILNDAPVAAFSFSPSKPTVSDVVEFVDASTDDGGIVEWHWEFGDGATSFEQNPKHQYSSKGKFTVKLTVTDDGGLTGVCEKQIQVVNVAPEVKIHKPEAGEIWTGARTIEYEATDADGDVLAIKLEYDSLGDDAGWQLIADGEENTGKYVWDTSKLSWGGIYKVRVTASDPDGGTGQDVSDEFTIVVLKRMVIAAPNPANDSVTFYYDIDTDGELFVYDVAGRLVHTAKLSATANSHEWNLTTGGRPVASGLYLYVVVTDDAERSEVGRLVIERL